MPQISRPTKQGGATTYGGKVSAGYTTILASEMDADLDTMYSAWNAGVDSSNIQPGSITGDKLAPGAVGSRELADGGIQTVDLGDQQVTTPKIADAPNGVTTAKLSDGAVTEAKLGAGAHLWTQPGVVLSPVDASKLVTIAQGSLTLGTAVQAVISEGTDASLSVTTNNPWNPQDLTKASWSWALNASDQAVLYRRAANAPAGSVASPLVVSPTGDLT